ncbi:hypothetical protein PFISCL1PPCAC_19962, partial [Pristionchus fissidentatus]
LIKLIKCKILLHSMSDFDWSDGDVDEGGRREEDEEDIEDYSNEDIDVELPECPIGEQSFQCRTDADNLPYFMSASLMTPAPLRQLFRFRIEEKWIGHSFPKHPHLNQADLWTIIYLVDSESIASGDSPIDDDLYAPWTKAGRSCQTWSYPCERKDGTITECSDGSLILRVIKYTHPVCVGLELYVARVEDSGVVTGTMLLAYTSKKFGDRNPPVRAKNKRIDSISKREIKHGYAIGQSARVILHSLSAPGILPHQVYNQGRKMERRRSNRGRLPHIDYGKIVEWKATGDFLSERTTHGNTHYFLSTKLSKEILLSNLVEHKELMERREEIKKQIDLWDGELDRMSARRKCKTCGMSLLDGDERLLVKKRVSSNHKIYHWKCVFAAFQDLKWCDFAVPRRLFQALTDEETRTIEERLFPQSE